MKPPHAEAFACSKFGDPSGGNDLIIVGPTIFAVIDGATPKGRLNDGLLVAEATRAALRELTPDMDAQQAVKFISERVAGCGIARSSSSCATFAGYLPLRREVWRVGDPWLMLDERVVAPRPTLENLLAKLRGLIDRNLRRLGVSSRYLRRVDIGRNVILPGLSYIQRFRNADEDHRHRFGAIDGSTVPGDLIEVIPVPDSVTQIVLATDGYPWIQSDLVSTEQVLHRRITEDPLMIYHSPKTKGVGLDAVSFDDRAYLRLLLRR